MENGTLVRFVFCIVVVFVCLFVCLSVRVFSFLNRKCFFSNGLFHFYNLHDVPCDKRFFFLWGGGGGGREGVRGGEKWG